MTTTTSKFKTVKQSLVTALGLVALVATLGACNRHDDHGYNNGYGGAYGASGYPTAPGGACLQSIPETSPTYTQTWGNYRQNRIQPYAWNQRNMNGGGGQQFGGGRRGYLPGQYSGFAQFPSEGLCGCQQQAFPACGPQGMTCIPGGGFGNAQIASWGYNNGGFVSNGFSGYNSFGGGQNGCFNNVAQICTPGQVMGGAVCQAVNPGNPYGVWIQQY